MDGRGPRTRSARSPRLRTVFALTIAHLTMSASTPNTTPEPCDSAPKHTPHAYGHQSPQPHQANPTD